MENIKSTHLWPVRAQLGECAFWDAPSESLFWVDIRAPLLHRHTAEGEPAGSWTLPAPVGCFALLEDGGRVVVCLRNGLAILHLGSGAVERMFDPEPDRPTNRLNDGKVSPCGRHFVFGSMDDRPEKAATGAFYCLSADGSFKMLAADVVVSNGLAWSPDGGTLYFSDSHVSTIWACDWDAESGTITNRRVFATTKAEQGRPDGAAMDADGHYWSAGVSAGRLNRFAPGGRCVLSTKLPVQAPTMPVFGGADGRTLFVTSHRHVASPAPDDGSIVVIRTAYRGAPQQRFRMR